jgi:RNA polymerase sigma-70 factor (ECF subfamily)
MFNRKARELDEYRTKSDEEVLTASRQKPHLFSLIYERYERPLMKKAYALTRNKDIASDIVQDTFTKIYLHSGSFVSVPGAKFSSWAYKILLNTFYTWWAKAKGGDHATTSLDEDMEAVLADPSTARAHERYELADFFESVVRRLPGPVARILRLYAIDGKSYKEIADLEGMTEGAVKVKMLRARKSIKELGIDSF